MRKNRKRQAEKRERQLLGELDLNVNSIGVEDAKCMQNERAKDIKPVIVEEKKRDEE